jgi:hypothetical protein
MEYDKVALDAHVEDFSREREIHLARLKDLGRSPHLFEEIPMVVTAMAARGYLGKITSNGSELEMALASYLNSKFPDAIDPEIPAAIEYARQYWMMAYGY